MIRRRTRRELLLTGAAGALLAPAAARAAGPSVSAATSDADRLRRLISVELLLLFCYRHVLDSSVLQPPARRALAPVPAQEEAHIQALERRLTARGGQAPPPPAGIAEANRYLGHRGVGGRLGQLKGEPDALSLLETLEQVVVGAYFVAMIKLEDPQLVVLAAQIMANDAQHEAVVRLQFPKGSPQEAVPYGLVQGLQ